jgi:hypothetical protein
MRESNPSEPATISVLLGGFQHTERETQDLEEERSELDPWSLYIYAMKAPMTRDRYKTRLAKFLDFIEIENGSKSLEDKARLTRLKYEHALAKMFSRQTLYSLMLELGSRQTAKAVPFLRSQNYCGRLMAMVISTALPVNRPVA